MISLTNKLLLVAIASQLAMTVDADPRCRRQGNCQTKERPLRGPSDQGYFRSTEYRALSAVEKLDQLWQQCLLDDTVQPQPWADFPNIMTQDATLSFGVIHDELPRGRPKINHAQGVVSLVSWEDLGGHNFTGIYEGGSDLGLLRLSEANFLLPESTGLTPSLAMKFLRDGMESANQLAIVSFEETDSWNFFENDFRTRVDFFTDKCAVQTIQRKMIEVTGTIQSNGLAEFAMFKTDGTAIPRQDVVFPFDINFVPNPAIAARYPSKPMPGMVIPPFYEQLQDIPDGEILFQVMATDVPEDKFRYPQGSTVRHIANIRTNSKTVTSKFGDARLFFRHEGMRQHAFQLEPGFGHSVPKLSRLDRWDLSPIVPEVGFPTDEDEARDAIRATMAAGTCPFAWLLQ